MVIKNNQQVARIKKIFFLVCIAIALAALALFLLDHTFYALLCVGVFSLWYIFFNVANYLYIEYSDNGKNILLRYYKAISFGSKEFSSIEFPKSILKKAMFEDSVFGKLADLTFIVKTKRGIAEYPTISLAAVSLNDRKRIQQSLKEILGN